MILFTRMIWPSDDNNMIPHMVQTNRDVAFQLVPKLPIKLYVHCKTIKYPSSIMQFHTYSTIDPNDGLSTTKVNSLDI